MDFIHQTYKKEIIVVHHVAQHVINNHGWFLWIFFIKHVYRYSIIETSDCDWLAPWLAVWAMISPPEATSWKLQMSQWANNLCPSINKWWPHNGTCAGPHQPYSNQPTSPIKNVTISPQRTHVSQVTGNSNNKQRKREKWPVVLWRGCVQLLEEMRGFS